MGKYVCMNDGGPFEGEAFTYPVSFEMDRFVLSDLAFFSLPSVKAYLTRNVGTHYYFLELFELYARRKYGVSKCTSAPDVSILADRRISGTGISLAEYRRQCVEALPDVPLLVGTPVCQKVSAGIDVLYVQRSSKGIDHGSYKTTWNERDSGQTKEPFPPDKRGKETEGSPDDDACPPAKRRKGIVGEDEEGGEEEEEIGLQSSEKR